MITAECRDPDSVLIIIDNVDQREFIGMFYRNNTAAIQIASGETSSISTYDRFIVCVTTSLVHPPNRRNVARRNVGTAVHAHDRHLTLSKNFLSPARHCQQRAGSVSPERGLVWHDSCVKPCVPDIDQCHGEAALIELVGAGF